MASSSLHNALKHLSANGFDLTTAIAATEPGAPTNRVVQEAVRLANGGAPLRSTTSSSSSTSRTTPTAKSPTATNTDTNTTPQRTNSIANRMAHFESMGNNNNKPTKTLAVKAAARVTNTKGVTLAFLVRNFPDVPREDLAKILAEQPDYASIVAAIAVLQKQPTTTEIENAAKVSQLAARFSLTDAECERILTDANWDFHHAAADAVRKERNKLVQRYKLAYPGLTDQQIRDSITANDDVNGTATKKNLEALIRGKKLAQQQSEAETLRKEEETLLANYKAEVEEQKQDLEYSIHAALLAPVVEEEEKRLETQIVKAVKPGAAPRGHFDLGATLDVSVMLDSSAPYWFRPPGAHNGPCQNEGKFKFGGPDLEEENNRICVMCGSQYGFRACKVMPVSTQTMKQIHPNHTYRWILKEDQPRYGGYYRPWKNTLGKILVTTYFGRLHEIVFREGNGYDQFR